VTTRPRHWAYALLSALALHAVALAWWLRHDVSEGARAAGQDGMQVSVGLAGAFTEPARNAKREEAPLATTRSADAADEMAEQDPDGMPDVAAGMQAEPPTEALRESEAEPEQETAAEMASEPAVEQVSARPAATMRSTRQADVVKPVTQSAKRIVEPKPPRASERAAQPVPKQPLEDDRSQAPAQTEQVATDTSNTTQRSSIKATGIGQRVETGGNPAARQSYLAEVLARIARHKRYPREARHDGVTGVVTVTFTVIANGTVLTQQVTGSSGDRHLDQAALDMLSRASPLPPIPRDMGVATLELTLPVEFSLNQKRKIF